MSRLMPITPAAIDLIKRRSPKGVCEVGAGEGLWVGALREEGVKAIGYDVSPRGASVLLGDHVAASAHADMSLLIVWPPDGCAVQDWISAWRGETIILCANRYRVSLGDCLSQYLIEEAATAVGRKGPTSLTVYRKSHTTKE